MSKDEDKEKEIAGGILKAIGDICLGFIVIAAIVAGLFWYFAYPV